MSTPSSKPSLENLPCFRTEEKKTYVEDGWENFGYRRIKILNERILIFIPSKQNYSKHVERI